MKKILITLFVYSLTLSSAFACMAPLSSHSFDASNILYIIIALVLGEFILTKTLGFLNHTNKSPTLPEELKEVYDEKKYKKSLQYETAKYKFGLISTTLSICVSLLMLSLGGFGWLDSFVRTFTENPILLALYFFGIISIFQTIVGIPFSYYSTFVIEEKFGFNKTSKKLFCIDIIKGLFLSALLGGGILSLIVWIYSIAGNNFWWYAWILMTFISLFFMMFYSSIIVPLFNKQTPLESGELRDAIEKFSNTVGFKLDNIFVIDGSKRSSKANAYFSGFGPKKRIVLYDTLIKDLSTEELVAVLAHEIGHYKRKHTLQMLSFSIIQTGIMLYIFGLTLSFPEVSQAL
ncbi:MAG: M48 family metallopeptidase, partial [Candidatus Gracilibacteria bacterium]|nr:M48 family metallopeptidase [Candidatus Gracilibacteria bacterium]